MKPFDLEAAKRGEPIVRCYADDRTEPVTFVGSISTGEVAVEHKDQNIYRYWPEELRMAPKKITLHTRVVFFRGNIDSFEVRDEPFTKARDNNDWSYRYTTIEVDAP